MTAQKKVIKKAAMREQLLELMKLNGWQRSELAVAVGVNASTVWRWIDDGKMPIPIIQGVVRELLDKARAESAAGKKHKQPA
jgi:predicted site-specific integrase-resolvase